jgi:hypothetical protein
VKRDETTNLALHVDPGRRERLAHPPSRAPFDVSRLVRIPRRRECLHLACQGHSNVTFSRGKTLFRPDRRSSGPVYL